MGSIRKPFREKKGNYRKISRLHRLEADWRSPRQTVSLNSLKTQLLVVFVAAFILFLMSLVNSYISSRITTPIRKLELSVNEIEKGNLNAKVDAEGSYEIRHLGQSVQNMAKQIQVLMADIVSEHEKKRKQEFEYAAVSDQSPFPL